MKSKVIFIIILLLMLPFCLFAKAGPPIPVPKLSIEDAATIASEYFYAKETRIRGQDYFKKSDYIIISAEYTNRLKDVAGKEWAWKIKFVHPEQNDHSIVYKITDAGEVVFLYGSE